MVEWHLSDLDVVGLDFECVVVEADEQFDFLLLPHRDEWQIRPYPPAVVGILRLP